MTNGRTLVQGVGIGAALMYLLDPRNGRRRRAIAESKLLHAARETSAAADAAARDIEHRAEGWVYRLLGSVHPKPADDRKLEARVRSRLGRVSSHPGAIDVLCDQGHVMLQGEVLGEEHNHVVEAVAHVPGVLDVEDRLRAHDQAEGIKSLQGEGHRHHGNGDGKLRPGWPLGTRAMVGVAGGLLMAWGMGRRSLSGLLVSGAGTMLLARAALNRPMKGWLATPGENAVIEIHKSIQVRAPLEEVFGLWAGLESFPRFMRHVRQVERIGDSTLRWVVDAPGGTTVEWRAHLTRFVPNELIAWKSEEGSTVPNEGSVRFEAADGSTRVHIWLRYEPPAGPLGHALAVAFGADPKKQIDDDMLRFKSLLEEGKATGAHGSVERAQILPSG